MQEDLGSDAVYNFVGDVLEDEYDSLADLITTGYYGKRKS